jgi:hypothetical protein
MQAGVPAITTPVLAQVPGGIALGAGLAGLLAAASMIGYPAALIHLTVAATVAGSALAVAAMSATHAPLVDISAATALAAVLAIGVVPRFGLALGGLSAAGGETTLPRLDNRMLRSDRLLIGMITGLSAVAVLAAVPAALSANRWQLLLAGAIGAGLLLRSRVYSQVPHVVAPRIAGVVVLLVLWFGVARSQVPGGVLFVVPVVVLGAGALLAGALPGMTPVVRARISRLLNGAELVLVVGEIGRHQRAAGRAVARIEVQHDVLLALERRERHRLHVGVGKLEYRRWLSRLQHRDRFYSKFFFKLQQPRTYVVRKRCRTLATYNRPRATSFARRLDAARIPAPALAEAPALCARRAAALRGSPRHRRFSGAREPR